MTINGIGTRLLNCTSVQSDCTCEGYYWFTFLYAPLIPLRKIRFIRELTDRDMFEFREIEELPKEAGEVFYTYFKGWVIYPLVIFWPIPIVVTEVYHGVLHLPDKLYNWAIAFAIIYLIALVWILADRYEAQGLPKDYKQQLLERYRMRQNELKKKRIVASKIKLDLHDIYNRSDKIDAALNEHIDYCVENRIKTLEIIPGKGSGQLKKKVIRFLQQKHIKNKYHRIDKDSKNWGRLFVHFKH